jgi:hypothetical protein
MGSKPLKARERIIYQNKPFGILAGIRDFLINNRIGGTVIQGLNGKMVAIEIFTLQGEKEIITLNFSRIGAYGRICKIKLV